MRKLFRSLMSEVLPHWMTQAPDARTPKITTTPPGTRTKPSQRPLGKRPQVAAYRPSDRPLDWASHH